MNGVARWLVTDPILVPAGTTHMIFRLETTVNAASGTLIQEISRPALFEVASPIF
jgi:hypothetical protein